MNLLCKLKSWIRRNRESAWKLGVVLNGLGGLLDSDIQWISNGLYEGKKWFADPFILDFNETQIAVLVEEYDYQVNRGRIAKIVIDRSSWTIVDCKILLDLPTHLSFPVIYREGSRILVTPENNCGNTFDLYEYDSSKERLVKIRQVCEGRLTDAFIRKFGSAFYILTTHEPHSNGSRLEILKSDCFEGPYKKVDEIKFDENVARNAGLIFEYEGKLIRPAQESNYSYGHGLVFQEVSFQNDSFSFSEVKRFLSSHPSFKDGIHTYNEYNGMGIVDVKGLRNPLVGKFFGFVHAILVKLGIKKDQLLQ